MRYYIAVSTDIPACQLPPTDDALKMHVLRAVYQCRIWLNSHLANFNPGNPTNSGWMEDEFGITPVCSLLDPAPKEFREEINLFCTDNSCKTSKQCQCVSYGMPCIDICKCSNMECTNTVTHADEMNDDDSDVHL